MKNNTKNRPYTLEKYSSAWANEFKKIKRKITPWFGQNLVSIEHVGSTAIACPDMVAKPNIDLCVIVTDLKKVAESYPYFIDAGYAVLGQAYVKDGGDYIVYDNPVTGYRTESIHIYQVDNPKPLQYRHFRDYLMTHEIDRTRYVACKKELFDAHRDEYRKYDDGKAELIEELKQKAALWKQQSI